MEEKTILIVDDEERVRKLLKDFLIKENYRTLEAKDGEEALKIFNTLNDSINMILYNAYGTSRRTR